MVCSKTTTVLQPFFRDHPGEPVPEENFWTLLPRHRRTNFGHWAFTVAGPTAWNSLPDYLRDPSLSEDTFRRLLKTYLFALY